MAEPGKILFADGFMDLTVGKVEQSERIYPEVLNHHLNYVKAGIGLAVTLNRLGDALTRQFVSNLKVVGIPE